jgi:hydroxybutyrate-dimer hydrolase
VRSPAAVQRCAELQRAGGLSGDTLEQQAGDALARLHRNGWTDGAIEAGAMSVAFDLWRAVAAGYASAYLRTPADAMPCGFGYSLLDAQGVSRDATVQERAAWWADVSGIPPAGGVVLTDTLANGVDAALPGLRCLRALWDDSDDTSRQLQQAVAATRASLPRPGLPVMVIHGADDGLVPEAFSGAAYARWASSHGRDVRYWRVHNAQHFDACLGLPALTTRYLPLLPYAYRALDMMWDHLDTHAPLATDAEIRTSRRASGDAGIEPLAARHLALP